MLNKNRLIYFFLVSSFFHCAPTYAMHVRKHNKTSSKKQAEKKPTDRLNVLKESYFAITERPHYAPFDPTIYSNIHGDLAKQSRKYQKTKSFLPLLKKIELVESYIEKLNKLLIMLNHPCMRDVAITQLIKINNIDSTIKNKNKKYIKKELSHNLRLLENELNGARNKQNILEQRKELEAQLTEQEQQLKIEYDFYIDSQYKETLTKLLSLLTKSRPTNSKNHVISPVNSISINKKLTRCNERISKENEKLNNLKLLCIMAKTEKNIEEAMSLMNQTSAVHFQKKVTNGECDLAKELTNKLEDERRKIQADAARNALEKKITTLDLNRESQGRDINDISDYWNDINKIFTRPVTDEKIRTELQQIILTQLANRKKIIEAKIEKILPKGKNGTIMSLLDKTSQISSARLDAPENELAAIEQLSFNEVTQQLEYKNVTRESIELLNVLDAKIKTDLDILDTDFICKRSAFDYLKKAQEIKQIPETYNNRFNIWKQNNGWTFFKWTWNPKPLLSSWASTITSFFSGWF